MSKFAWTAAAAVSLAGCETAGTLGGVLAGAAGAAQAAGLSDAEIDAGLRQALTLGTETVAGQLGAVDGFFGDPRVQIPLPGRLADLQNNLAAVGASGPLDDLQLLMNRGAEAAMPVARDLVVDAVSSITLEDALGLLQGGETAATDFLRARTEPGLVDAFRPQIDQALGQSGAFQALDDVTGRYGLSGLTSSLRGDLAEQATSRALDGMFLYVADEERKIRENPAARTTDLLRRVFGSQL